MKYFIIVGEASGDLHGSKLIEEIKKQDPAAEVVGWGGDMMMDSGAIILQHYRDIAYMGFAEVARHMIKILRHIQICKGQIIEFNPDVLILVDYPGFNLRIAKWARSRALKVSYYIAPQLWAWNPKRAEILRNYVDRLFVILPFEVDFFRKYKVSAEFVGHPLVESIEVDKLEEKEREKIIALLPGSRKQEIKMVLPIMLSLVDLFPNYQFIIGGAASIEDDFYESIIGNQKEYVRLWKNRTYELLRCAKAAIVTSGTATLETALHNVPQVVVYKGSKMSYFIAKRLVHVPFISLVNLIAEKEVVPELIQKNLTKENLQATVSKVLGEKGQMAMKTQYKIIRNKLGTEPASKRAAKGIIELAQTNYPG